MKCGACKEERIFFTVMRDIAEDIGWASHVLVEDNGSVGLFHYQCVNIDPMAYYAMFVELMGGELVIVKP